nr:hypothetical protein [Tanacetum cinerariifolium]
MDGRFDEWRWLPVGRVITTSKSRSHNQQLQDPSGCGGGGYLSPFGEYGFVAAVVLMVVYVALIVMQRFTGNDFPRDSAVDGIDDDMILETLLNDNPTLICREKNLLKNEKSVLERTADVVTPPSDEIVPARESASKKGKNVRESCSGTVTSGESASKVTDVERLSVQCAGKKSVISKKHFSKNRHLVVKPLLSYALESSVGFSYEATDDLGFSEADYKQLESKDSSKATILLSSASTHLEPLDRHAHTFLYHDSTHQSCRSCVVGFRSYLSRSQPERLKVDKARRISIFIVNTYVSLRCSGNTTRIMRRTLKILLIITGRSFGTVLFAIKPFENQSRYGRCKHQSISTSIVLIHGTAPPQHVRRYLKLFGTWRMEYLLES